MFSIINYTSTLESVPAEAITIATLNYAPQFMLPYEQKSWTLNK